MSGARPVATHLPISKTQSRNTAVTLEELQEYVHDHAPNHFEALPPLQRYVFSKLFVPNPFSSVYGDAAFGGVEELLVILVGSIPYKGKASNAWARATGENVHFYLNPEYDGRRNSPEQPLIPIDDKDTSRISFHEPFNKVGPKGNGGDNSAKRRARRQMLINYAFMLKGELRMVEGIKITNFATGKDYFAKGTVNTDLREVFKSACAGCYYNVTPDQRKRLVSCSEATRAESTDDKNERSGTEANDNEQGTSPIPWPIVTRGAFKRSYLAVDPPQKVAKSAVQRSEFPDSLHSSLAGSVRPELKSAATDSESVLTDRTSGRTTPGTDAYTMPALPIVGIHKADQGALAMSEDTMPSTKRMRSASRTEALMQPPAKRINTGGTALSLQPGVPNQENASTPLSRTSPARIILAEFNHAFMTYISDIVTELQNEQRLRADAESDIARLKANQEDAAQEQAEEHRRELDQLKVQLFALQDVSLAADNNPEQEIEQLTHLNADLELEIVDCEQRAKEAEDRAKEAKKKAEARIKKAEEDAEGRVKKAEERERQWKDKCGKITRLKEDAEKKCDEWRGEADKERDERLRLFEKHQKLKDDFAASIQRNY